MTSMKKIVFIIIGLVIVVFTPLQGYVESTSKELRTLIHDLNQAAFLEFYLYKKGDNPLISPFSIQASFLMAYMGARGETAQQIAQVLSITLPQDAIGSTFSNLYEYLQPPKMEDTSYELKLGNGLWVDKTYAILPSYKSLAATKFHGTVQHIDFTDPHSAANLINAWASLKTGGIIKQFLSARNISRSTQMLLINGMVLKGPWKNPFDTKLTGMKPFLTSNNISQSVLMMHQTQLFPYYEDADSQVVALPLQSNTNQAELALVIFLPKVKKLRGIFDFYYSQQQNNPEKFLNLINKFQNKTVDIYIPKFAFNKRFFLKNFFLSLGIQDAFNNKADFSGITGNKNLFISNAFHKSFVSVDEEGVFAAASNISFGLKSSIDRGPIMSFIANHPFFYCIVDLKTKLLLFMGIVDNPSVSIKNGEA